MDFLSYIDEIPHRWIERSILGVWANQPLSDVPKARREIFSSHTFCRHLVSHRRNARRTTCMGSAKECKGHCTCTSKFIQPGKAYPAFAGYLKALQPKFNAIYISFEWLKLHCRPFPCFKIKVMLSFLRFPLNNPNV